VLLILPNSKIVPPSSYSHQSCVNNLFFAELCARVGVVILKSAKSESSCFYFEKLLLPINLTFIYPHWHIDTLNIVQYIYPIGALVLVVGLWWACTKIGRAPLSVALIYGGTLFPALGVFECLSNAVLFSGRPFSIFGIRRNAGINRWHYSSFF